MTFDDAICARTLLGEVRGETNEGQRAVAHVILNRLKDGRWGKTLAQVCLAPYQFTCWMPKDPNWKLLVTIADNDSQMIMMGAALSAARQEPDFTQNSTHYFAASMAKAPIWTLGATYVGQFGGHKFYKGVA